MRPLGFALLLALALPQPLAAQPAGQVTVSRTHESDGTSTLVHEVLVPAPPKAVWQAISTPEGWMRWAVPLARWVDGEPGMLETAYEASAAPGSATTIRQRFVVQVPDRLLVFRTEKAPEGFPHFDSYRKVTSVFELEPRGDGTRLRLISTGYPADEAGADLVRFFTTGNAEVLEELRKLFAAPG